MDITHTDQDGYTIRVFPHLGFSWGVSFTSPDGEKLHYSPTDLPVESYGFHWEDEAGDLLDEGVPWTDAEWTDALVELCEVYREVYEGPDIFQ